MSGGLWVNGKGFGVVNVGKVGDEFEVVDNLIVGSIVIFDIEV